MSPLKATTLWLLYSLGALALAHPDNDNDTRLKTLTLPANNPGAKILNRQASDVPTTDTCENGGLSCEYCFGEGNIACPLSDGYCYDPSDSTNICPEDVGSDSASGSGSTSDETDSATASGTSSPTIDDETSATPTSGAGSTDAAGGITGDSGDADDQSSGTSTGSSSANSGSNSGQGSAANGNSNGSPVQNSSGNSEFRGGLIGVLAAGSLAIAAAMHLRI
jgi:hypothetical protein